MVADAPASAPAPAGTASRAWAARPPRGAAALVRTGPLSPAQPDRPSPAGLHSSSQARRLITVQDRAESPVRTPDRGVSGTRAVRRAVAARAPHPAPRSAPAHPASARPAAADDFTVPGPRDPAPFPVCGLARDMGLGRTVAVVC
ncbi:hypothetical protein ACIQ6V_16875 [Streptomyces sp. NPDC096198]|uniref:hypothetical protein n=1 Tax=Streptomyces sp. NPDC096198 TaxID=3366080 RepID=UPI0038302FE7